MDFSFKLSFNSLDKAQVSAYGDFLTADARALLPEADVHAFGAFNDDTGELIGVTVFREDDPAMLLSISVSNAYRRKGLGSAMVLHLMDLLLDHGITGMECLLHEDGEETKKVQGTGLFLWRSGFIPTDDYADFSVTLRDARQNPVLGPILENGIPVGYEAAPDPASEDGKCLIEMLPIPEDGQQPGYSPAFSTIYRKDGQILGCFLVSDEKDLFLVNFMHLRLRDKGIIHTMIAHSLLMAAREYGEQVRFRFMAVTERSDEVYSELFPKEGAAHRLTHYEMEFIKNEPLTGEEYQLLAEGDADAPNSADGVVEDAPGAAQNAFGSVEAADSGMPNGAGDAATENGGMSEDADAAHTDGAGESSPTPPPSHFSHFSVDPEFLPLTDADLVCRDCIFRFNSFDVYACHKYEHKPDQVIDGGACEKYHRERSI